ncbi:hypothetical protein AKJ16_DCAP27653, partial [Drosera capensis]
MPFDHDEIEFEEKGKQKPACLQTRCFVAYFSKAMQRLIVFAKDEAGNVTHVTGVLHLNGGSVKN